MSAENERFASLIRRLALRSAPGTPMAWPRASRPAASTTTGSTASSKAATRSRAWCASFSIATRATSPSGISCCELEGELIRRYGETFERAPVLAQLGFPDERILKS
jgi:hypothetical protein